MTVPNPIYITQPIPSVGIPNIYLCLLITNVMIWPWVPNGMVWAIRSLEHRDAPPPHWSIFCLAISGGWEKSGGWSFHLTPIPGLQNADVQQLGIQPMTRWKSHIYIHIYIYYNNWNATSTHIWSNCSHSNAFIHFHHLLLGAKVNQCASVQQPTNLHLAPILIWENIEKRHVFPKNLVLSNPTPISSTVSICKT